jgi:hypothetical protein
MNPLGFMPPFINNDTEQLRQARAHAAMLREEWRLANSGRPRGPRRTSSVARVRNETGRALIGLGKWLLPAEPAATMTARRPEPGC